MSRIQYPSIIPAALLPTMESIAREAGSLLMEHFATA